MMIPITRKEKYINEIVGGGNTAPGTPQTREELFFAAILGEVVAPSPITRAEKYLAKIANKYNGELPEPVTRIERFLARAAGMNVSIPAPVTREEMFWADYALIVEKEISGIPPLTFNAIAGALKNYRIYGNTETLTRSYSGSAPLSFPIEDGSVSNYRVYGNTVNGESVGDLVTDSQSEHYGKYAIPITNNSETANIYLDEPLRKVGDEAEYVDYAEQKWHRVRANYLQSSDFEAGAIYTGPNYINRLYQNSKTPPGALNYDSTRKRSTNLTTISGTYTISIADGWEFGIVMFPDGLNSGELFTYNTTPVTISNCTFAIQIKKSDLSDISSADISDYKIMLNKGSTALPYEPYIENTEVNVTLPALLAQSTSNSLSIVTTVQPSSVAVDVDEVVSCGDKVTDGQSVNYGNYKIPVTLTADSAETTDIYLDEPLARSGNNADYIDYATQKRHNSDGTESSITLPEIAVTAGTNTLSVGTEVQPSEVYIKYEGA